MFDLWYYFGVFAMEDLIFEFCLWIFLKLHSLFMGLILFWFMNICVAMGEIFLSSWWRIPSVSVFCSEQKVVWNSGIFVKVIFKTVCWGILYYMSSMWVFNFTWRYGHLDMFWEFIRKLFKSVIWTDSMFDAYKMGSKLNMWNLNVNEEYNET